MNQKVHSSTSDDLSENNTQLIFLKMNIYQNVKLLSFQVMNTIAYVDKPKIVTTIHLQETKQKFSNRNSYINNIIYGQY